MWPSIRTLALVVGLLATVLPAPLAAASAPDNIVIAAVKSPVVADGDVAGRPTDINLLLDRSFDPQIAGRSLLQGRTISVVLPDAFVRTNVPVTVPETGALVKGWPQGGLDGYTVTLAGTHTIVFTATRDIVPKGPDNPGIKVLHVRGRAFTNPPPGNYQIAVVAETGAGAAVETGSGILTIRPAVVPSVNPTNALFPQPSNNNWQRVPEDTATSIPLDFLLFGADGLPLNGVGVVPADRARFPRYTGGLLVRDTDGSGALDPAIDSVVGGIIGAAPDGATGQRAASPVGADGRPVLSGQLGRPDGTPAPGILRVLFRTGNRPGAYTPTFELAGGTAARMTVVATTSATPTPPGLPNTGAGGARRDLPAWGMGAAVLALLTVVAAVRLATRKNPLEPGTSGRRRLNG